MKIIKRSLLPSILTLLLLTIGAGRALAYDHDSNGWYDEHHHHHPYIQHGGHQGYWDHDQSGARIFISI